MPHLTIQYSNNVDADIQALCQALSDTLLAQQIFPRQGTRVLAYPATHAVVAGGDGAFIYINLLVTKGRTPEVLQAVGEALLAAAKAVLAPQFADGTLGLTLHIDEIKAVYEGKHRGQVTQA